MMDVELAPGRILEHLGEARTPIAAFGTADTGIVILLDDVPAPVLGDLAQGGRKKCAYDFQRFLAAALERFSV
jgi:hypothetical protein